MIKLLKYQHCHKLFDDKKINIVPHIITLIKF